MRLDRHFFIDGGQQIKKFDSMFQSQEYFNQSTCFSSVYPSYAMLKFGFDIGPIQSKRSAQKIKKLYQRWNLFFHLLNAIEVNKIFN